MFASILLSVQTDPKVFLHFLFTLPEIIQGTEGLQYQLFLWKGLCMILYFLFCI